VRSPLSVQRSDLRYCSEKKSRLPCLRRLMTEQERNVKAGEYAGQSPDELCTEPE
jgi:hypothetical protein